MATYTTILTNNGKALLANAVTNTNKVNFSHIALGDGNGSVPTPNETRTALVHETTRITVNAVRINPTITNSIEVEIIVPTTNGGYTIREIGVYAGTTLVAIGNFPPTYKPTASEGGAREMAIKVVFDVQNADVVQVTLDNSLIYATQKWTDDNYIRRNELINNLTTADATKPLTAAQGKTLQDTKLDKTANAVSASKLQTARNIAISGAVSGNANFDGSGNITINTAIDTITIPMPNDANAYKKLIQAGTTTDYGFLAVGNTGENSGYVEIATTDDGNEGIYATQYGLSGSIEARAKLLNQNHDTELPGTVYARNVVPQNPIAVANGGTGNAQGIAPSATKLQTARNIAISGAVTGNANFDGSSNININTSINNASTTQAGIVQLSDSINDNSITTAATANAVKTVNDKLLKETIIDLKSLDPDTYYAVYTEVKTDKRNFISIQQALYDNQLANGVNKPAWITHDGFVLNIRWWVSGYGWGTMVADRIIESFQYNFTGDKSPILTIGQTWTSSREFVYLRGGAKYRFIHSPWLQFNVKTDDTPVDGQNNKLPPKQLSEYNADNVPKPNFAIVNDNINTLKNRTIFGVSNNSGGNIEGTITTSTGLIKSDNHHYIDIGNDGVNRVNFATWSGRFNFVDTNTNNMIYLDVPSRYIDCNAATANQLKNARTINIAGAVTGSAVFNGSSDITINTSAHITTVPNLTQGSNGYWTTADFINWLQQQGAFDTYIWSTKQIWSYAESKTINDTGCGDINLAGAVIEVIGYIGAYTIRIITAPSSPDTGKAKAEFVYLNHGPQYNPGWYRNFNTTDIIPVTNGGTGNSNGIAPSASKLQTARNIAIAGAVSGNANFDGSGNITINTAANVTTRTVSGSGYTITYFDQQRIAIIEMTLWENQSLVSQSTLVNPGDNYHYEKLCSLPITLKQKLSTNVTLLEGNGTGNYNKTFAAEAAEWLTWVVPNTSANENVAFTVRFRRRGGNSDEPIRAYATVVGIF